MRIGPVLASIMLSIAILPHAARFAHAQPKEAAAETPKTNKRDGERRKENDAKRRAQRKPSAKSPSDKALAEAGANLSPELRKLNLASGSNSGTYFSKRGQPGKAAAAAGEYGPEVILLEPASSLTTDIDHMGHVYVRVRVLGASNGDDVASVQAIAYQPPFPSDANWTGVGREGASDTFNGCIPAPSSGYFRVRLVVTFVLQGMEPVHPEIELDAGYFRADLEPFLNCPDMVEP